VILLAQQPQAAHIINGHVMSILIDEDPAVFKTSGLIGLEIEGAGKIL
jgi:hypothetical protein